MSRPPMTGILITLRRFKRSIAAVSAVEFAMILPVMLTLYLGGTEVTQSITIKRKTTLVSRTIGDLVAQNVSITNADMQKIFSATAAVVAPYSSANLKVVVSSVGINNDGIATIQWSDGYQTAARVKGSTITLPEGLAVANTTLIWAEARYDHTPPIGYVLIGTIPLKDQLYLRPRNINSIERVS
jgi:Flp pilus assembly protein TadG